MKLALMPPETFHAIFMLKKNGSMLWLIQMNKKYIVVNLNEPE